MARLRASRYGLAIIAVVSILLIGLVGLAVSVMDNNLGPSTPAEVPADPAPDSDGPESTDDAP